MGTIADKLTYLNTTKQNLKTMLQYANSNITNNTTFRAYVSGLFQAYINILNTPENIFNALPKISTTAGTSQSINNTIEAPMRISLSPSELSQIATPTPSSPQDIHTISGSNTIKVEGKNLFDKDSATDGKEISGTGIYNNSSWCVSDYIPVKYGETYIKNKTGGDNYLTFDSNKTQLNTSTLSFSNSKITINDANIKFIRINLTIANKDTYQLELGTTSTTYTPYISQEADIDLGYENLFDVNSATLNQTRYYIQEDGSVVNTHNWGGDGTNYFNNVVLQAGTYTLSYIPNLSGTERNVRFRLYNNETSSNIINSSITITNDVRQTYTFTLTDKTTLKICIMPNQANGGTITIKEIMLNKGTTALPYTPYGKAIEYCKIGTYEDKFIRNSGKNLAKVQDASVSSANYSLNISNNLVKITTTGSDNSFDLCGGTRTGTYVPTYANANDYHLTSADNGTYKLSISNVSTNITGTAYQQLNIITNQRYIQTLINTSGVLSGTTSFTLQDGEYVKSLYLWTNGTTTITNLQFYVQLEKGSIASNFEPYGTNQWYIKKNIGKVVLDGTENWGSAGEGDTTNGTSMYVSISTAVSSAYKDLISDNFKFINRNNLTSSSLNFITGGGGNSIVLNIDNSLLGEASLAGFKTWLGTHNTTAYYPLATPTYTQITGTLAEQLENVYNAQSQTGQTNISQINNDLSFVLDVQAIEEL